MKNKHIILLTSVGTVALAGLIIAKRKNTQNYSQEVRQLFSLANDVSDNIFHYQQLEGLPQPVQRYFRHVLPDQYSYISTVRLTHEGQFKTGPKKAWSNIKGEQFFTAAPPGFVWKGRTALFSAVDKYVVGRGSLSVTLASLIGVVHVEGASVDQGELLRWLGESVWFPTNLLPNERLSWLPIDENTAKLSYNYSNQSLYYVVAFNELGEIIRLQTKRYISEDKLETWVGELLDYQVMNGVKIPTRIRATWKLPEGDYTYVNFRLRKIEYNYYESF
uniref:Uncharacterized protein n=1 Tax=Roseihalotalea indica TaxID=2867963 RepID=A0AA49GLW1_9BACT|nr:hypothetical protein K4G66_19730 [Tunicatimonas sp. TK19036]